MLGYINYFLRSQSQWNSCCTNSLTVCATAGLCLCICQCMCVCVLKQWVVYSWQTTSPSVTYINNKRWNLQYIILLMFYLSSTVFTNQNYTFFSSKHVLMNYLSLCTSVTPALHDHLFQTAQLTNQRAYTGYFLNAWFRPIVFEDSYRLGTFGKTWEKK